MAKESLYAHAQKVMKKKEMDDAGNAPRPSDSSQSRDSSEASKGRQSLYSHAQKFVTKREEYKPSAEYQRLQQRPTPEAQRHDIDV